jgi:hypothetical protein
MSQATKDPRAMDFFCGKYVAGVLEVATRWEPGRWKYEPYRGPGHLQMVTMLKNGESAICFVDTEGRRFRFVVVSVPEYGVLEVSSVQPEAIPENLGLD